MPEGKLRSGVYKSFIMCDDPRGVVERGAIKKQSKTRNSICSGTNQRFDHPSKPKERSEMAPRKSTEDVPPPPSSFQLLRVSKGIQKLNVAIDSYSKGSSYETVLRPEDIAKGLLRGALDLEESLAMLSSIQENDIKQKTGINKNGRRDLRFQRSMSDRFGERIEKRMMVQERDCHEELRNVIRESFHRQNLLTQTTSTETKKTRVVRSGFASSSGAASSSTSSSQSSMVSGSTKSSASSDIPRRAPSLIARLMGLDASPPEPNNTPVKHIDKPVIANLPSERQEQLKKKKKKNKESPETVRCNSSRQAVLQSLPGSENPSRIVLIKPVNVVQPKKDEKPGNKRPVLPKKRRMQGEVHPRMINQKKDHQAQGGSKTSSTNTMKLPSSPTKKDKMVRKVEENEGKVMKLLSPSNVKAVTRESKPKESIKKIYVKKEDMSEAKDRQKALKPPANPATTHKKSNGSSDMSRNKNQRSRLSSSSSSSSSSDEQKSNSRLKKSGEASKRSPKKKLHQRDNDLASENNSSSSQDTRVSAEETTHSQLHIQGHCDNGEITSCPATIQHSLEQETSLRSFLSNSSDFISYAENLFDFNNNTNRSQETTCHGRDSIVISDHRLALDFAKEVARRRSPRLITKPTFPLRSAVHIDELLMEVCDGFDSLRSYRDTFLNQSSFVKESIHMLLEKDLFCNKKEMTSGVWDLGWRSEFQIDETHQAVVDLEKLILSGLIQEIFS
ncbi:unnamed protein product [Eruca vesicaria subsp. sativa]|uniref:DUF3741 domain-containing protein n=1 Tax=Eruca vesicaria subsp. sativa TaxID=29727 RepID=A0ABC8LHB2_ERUVS|nr:unnamed protein product [Eruca vesicaria subsp. sativa]